jgi:hypothetical protein
MRAPLWAATAKDVMRGHRGSAPALEIVDSRSPGASRRLTRSPTMPARSGGSGSGCHLAGAVTARHHRHPGCERHDGRHRRGTAVMDPAAPSRGWSIFPVRHHRRFVVAGDAAPRSATWSVPINMVWLPCARSA